MIRLLTLVVLGMCCESIRGWEDVPILIRPAVSETHQHYGVTVAINSNYLVVGTNMDDEDVNGGAKTDVGSVNIFKQTGGVWDEMQSIVPADGENDDKFGSDVSVSGDKVVIGNHKGTTYVYKYETSTWNLLEQKDESSTGSCGYAVEIFGDFVAYGCPLENSNEGAVKIYKLDSTGTEKYFTTDTPTTNTPTTPFTLTGTSNSFFGDSLAMYDSDSSPDETYLVVAYQSGVNVYKYNSGTSNWDSDGTITKSPILRKDGQYGRTVDIYGNRIVIASYDSVSSTVTVTIYKRGASTWDSEQVFTESYNGATVAIYDTSLLVGFYDTAGSSIGVVRRYTYSPNTWTLDKTLLGHNVEAGDHFGRSVAAWDTNFVVGAPYDDDNGNTDKGSVYLFNSNTAEATLLSHSFQVTISLQLYTANDYVSTVTAPYSPKYSDQLYVGISETNSVANFKFVVNTCFTSQSSDSSNTATKYDVFANKCPADTTFAEESSTNDHFRFRFRAFDYSANTGQSIYIHCEIFLCLTSDTSETCSQTCSGGKRKRRSAQTRSNVVADVILASKKITIAPPTCGDLNCPGNSKCSLSYPIRCECEQGFVLSDSRQLCLDYRIININGVHFKTLDDNKKIIQREIDRSAVIKERLLIMLLKKLGVDDVIDGVRLVNGRSRNFDVVYDIMILVSNKTTSKDAYKTFLSVVTSNIPSVFYLTSRLLLNEDVMFPIYKCDSRWEKEEGELMLMRIVVVAVICTAMFLLVFSVAYVMYRYKFNKNKSPKGPGTNKGNEAGQWNIWKEVEIGKENVAVEVDSAEKNA